MHISEIGRQDATNDNSGIYLYECPETGEYVYYEDLPDYIEGTESDYKNNQK